MLILTHRAIAAHLPISPIESFVNRCVFGAMVDDGEEWDALDLLQVLLDDHTMNKLWRLYRRKLLDD